MRPLTDTVLFDHLDAAWAAGDDAEVARIADQLDAMDTADRASGTASLVAAALWYTEIAGLRVFPLQPRSKTPLPGSHGCHDATTDPATIRGWLASPGHRAVLLSPSFKNVGTAFARGRIGGRRTTIWVVQFGRR